MVSTIDLNRVRLFVRVAEAGSFTGAARLSGLPTSSVSRAVAALERELAVRLIQRTTRRLQLTEAGRVYYESVSQVPPNCHRRRALRSGRALTPPFPSRTGTRGRRPPVVTDLSI